MTTLFDMSARDAVAYDLDATLFVEAGAGTGKTHALVRRVVNLVVAGVDIREVAAITFTEAAAAELRERIREALAEEARADDERRAAPCRRALSAFDDAAITTLHGFAQRILAEHPLEAGLPPGFDVLDPIEASIQLDEGWAAFVDEMFATSDLERALTVVASVGYRFGRLLDVARALHEEWDRLGSWSRSLRPIADTDCSALVAALGDALTLASACRDPADKLLAHLALVASLRERLEAHAGDEPALLELLTALPRIASNLGRKDSWGGCKPDVVAHLERAQQLRDAVYADVVEPAVDHLLAAIATFVRRSIEARRAAGRLEFHDLLVRARDLLRSDAAVRATLHARYRRLLLDEFQDTDPLQIEIAVLIATSDPDAASKQWWECAVDPGRLFVVGDPKQSIYRFRRADIALYLRVRELVGRREQLTQSFRSRPGIVDFVNELFSALLTEHPDGLQAAYAPIGAERPPCPATAVPVSVIGGPVERGSDLGDLRRREADDIAAAVRRIKQEGWRVARPRADDPEHTEPARFGDIAILLPSRTTLTYLEQALDDAGIPARIESESLVYATTDVADLVAILGAIDDPTDDVAVVAALRTPGFACRDDWLVEHARAGGQWDYRAAPPAGLRDDHPVTVALATLRHHHELRAWETVTETVERVIRERGLEELAIAHLRPRDHWRRLRFVADAARAYADGGGASLRGFVGWLRSQVDQEARAVEVVVPEPDDDAVRILTVHGAKGLEFPVVILAGLSVQDRSQTGPVLWGEDGPEFRLRAKPPLQTPGYAAIQQRAKDADEAEQLRLLYVAATRARDHLVLSLHHRETDRCAAARLLARLDTGHDLYRAFPAAGRIARRAGAASPAIHDPGERDAWVARWDAALAAGIRAPTVSATGLAVSASGLAGAATSPGAPSDDQDEQSAEERPPWQRGRAGTAIGRAVHAVLQTIDLADGAGLEATARAQALAEGIPDRATEIAALAASALQAPVVRDAVTSGRRLWREVPIGAVVDGVLVEGFIDLLIEGPDGLVVVDYKTDGVPTTGDLDAVLAKYRVQGAAYALALSASLGRRVARCVFVFARSPQPLERDIDDVDEAVREVRHRLGLVGSAASAGGGLGAA